MLHACTGHTRKSQRTDRCPMERVLWDIRYGVTLTQTRDEPPLQKLNFKTRISLECMPASCCCLRHDDTGQLLKILRLASSETEPMPALPSTGTRRVSPFLLDRFLFSVVPPGFLLCQECYMIFLQTPGPYLPSSQMQMLRSFHFLR